MVGEYLLCSSHIHVTLGQVGQVHPGVVVGVLGEVLGHLVQAGAQKVSAGRLVRAERLKRNVEAAFWRILTEYVRQHGLLPDALAVDVVVDV